MAEQIFYEHPLNERIRTLLRLEYLFNHLFANNNLDTLINILQITEISKRFDLRFECMQTLDKLYNTLHPERFHVTRHNISRQINILQSGKGKFGEFLIQNELLTNIIHRSHMSGGLFPNDLPYLKFWLQQPEEKQKQELYNLTLEFTPLKEAITTILQATRDDTYPEQAVTDNGVYNKILDNNTKLQLIRIAVDQHIKAYPEISGNGRFIGIRFMSKELLKDKPNLITNLINFAIYYCA